ncbi:unnamed protein product [Adineta steineri]|uniref:WDHD1 first WD40 domain-containing protein n=1 Tax=Adineta steineri TaxID=433720 RepID=A0A814WM90_9BILA|nr:unnamed protein product [Adineta steineri]CAF4100007.1 unnamed protein product [Adineta steineri]
MFLFKKIWSTHCSLEIIKELDKMVTDLLRVFAGTSGGRLSNKVVVYRDGVDTGHYQKLRFGTRFSHFIICSENGYIFITEITSGQVSRIQCAEQFHWIGVHKSEFFLKEYHLYVGTNTNELQVRSFSDGSQVPDLVRLTQPASPFCLSNSFLYFVTRNVNVCKMNLNSNLHRHKYFFHGHEAPILALNVHEHEDKDKQWLATLSSDHLVRIFDINDGTLIDRFKVIKKSNDIATGSSLVKIDWDRTDHMLAIPVENMVQFYESKEWSIKKTYEDNSNHAAINLISFSPCRTLFIISYANGQLSIINRLTFGIYQSYSSQSTVCSLVWNPVRPILTCTTMAGQCAHIDVNQHLVLPPPPPPAPTATPTSAPTADKNEDEEDDHDSEEDGKKYVEEGDHNKGDQIEAAMDYDDQYDVEMENEQDPELIFLKQLELNKTNIKALKQMKSKYHKKICEEQNQQTTADRSLKSTTTMNSVESGSNEYTEWVILIEEAITNAKKQSKTHQKQ